MKITVITVCLNSADTIEKTIQSVIAQDYHSLEYIVIDGGSTDGTLAILDKYRDYIDIKVSEPDNGIFDAMNKGIGMATGDVIAILNSDDWYEKDALKMVENAFLESGCDCVCCDNYVVRKDGKKVYYNGTDMRTDDLHYRMIYFHSAIFCKRQYFRKSGNFDLTYKMAADYDWFLRVTEQKAKMYLLHRPVFTFSYGGISSVHETECAAEARLAASRHLSEDKKEYQEKIDNRFYDILIRNADIKCVYGYLAEILGKHRENIIWGAGVRGIQCFDWFQKIGIGVCAVIDSNSLRWGERIQGAEISPPGILRNKICNLIITPDSYASDIRNMALQAGAEEICIFELKKLCRTLAQKLEISISSRGMK